jgi:hypothetical protein
VRPEHSYSAPDTYTYSNLIIGGYAYVHARNQIINNYYLNANTDSISLSGSIAFLSVFIETMIQFLALL